MKPLKVKKRTNTSVSSEVITTALYPAAAACGPWRNTLVFASSCVDLSSCLVVIPIEESSLQ